MNASKVPDMPGTMLAKWTFSTQMAISQAALKQYLPSFDESEMTEAFASALTGNGDFDPLGSITLTLTGAKDISISWQSEDRARSYSLSLSFEKTLLTDETVVNDVVTSATYSERSKWNFAVSTQVLKETVSDYADQLETAAVRSQYEAALAAGSVDAATVYTRVESGRSVSFSWQDLDGYTSYRLGRSSQKIYQPDLTAQSDPANVTQVKDPQGNLLYQLDQQGSVIYLRNLDGTFKFESKEKWGFSAETLALRSEVAGHTLQLETQELRDQYDAVMTATPLATAFTKSQSGDDVSYSWQSKDKARTYSLGKTLVTVETKDDSGNPVYTQTAGRWSFSEQVMVLKSAVAAFVALLSDGDQKSAMWDALDLLPDGVTPDETTNDVDQYTSYARSSSGADVSYSWRSADEARLYSLSAERIKNASGVLLETKWTFPRNCRY